MRRGLLLSLMLFVDRDRGVVAVLAAEKKEAHDLHDAREDEGEDRHHHDAPVEERESGGADDGVGRHRRPIAEMRTRASETLDADHREQGTHPRFGRTLGETEEWRAPEPLL